MTAASDTAKLPKPSQIGAFVRNAVGRHAIVGLLLVLIVVFTVEEPLFLSLNNGLSILQAASIVALLGVGVTVSLATGGFDLSIGSMAAFTQMAAAYIMVVLHGSTVEAVAGCLVIGLLVGLFNGFLVVRLRIPDLLATLGVLFLLSGLELIPSGGHSIATGMILPNGDSATGAFTESFLALGRGRVGGLVPNTVVIMLVVAALLWVLMEKTRWGRVFYAIGGNELAVRLAGSPSHRFRVAAYVISSLIATIGGILLAARVGRGEVSTGSSLLLDSVAAALIGFAVRGKNHPNVLGTVFGAILVAVLLNGLTMLNAPYYAQDFIKGVVLVGALSITFGLSGKRG
jgi:simple sugar transport system permease protein